LQHDEEQQTKDMEAARAVQRLIMPPDHGVLGAISYVVHSRPGQRVAGDLFDFIRLDEHRAAVLIGDVEGKGIAAGMVMSNVQAHLSRLLRQTGDPGVALSEVSKLVADYSDRQGMDAGKAPTYLTLWAGVFDSKARKLTYVDAGHGHWLVRFPGRGAQRVEYDGGFPMGIDPTFQYKNEQLDFLPGMRVVLYTDGVVEQRSPHGGIFGLERTIATLEASGGIEDDVNLLLAALAEYASFGAQVNLPFTDDVTVASVALAP
jgi:sigma-B regulation protein RsbU (phosphoserine phosphatase)